MAETEYKFGEFFDKIAEETEKSHNIDAQIFIEEWVDIVSPEEWKKVKQMPLTEELALAFVEDMAGMFWRRLSGIDSERLYDETIKSGHDFLEQIKEVVKQFGIEISSQRSLTPSEALFTSGLIQEVDETE